IFAQALGRFVKPRVTKSRIEQRLTRRDVALQFLSDCDHRFAPNRYVPTSLDGRATARRVKRAGRAMETRCKRAGFSPEMLPWIGAGELPFRTAGKMDKPLRCGPLEGQRDKKSPLRRCFEPRPPFSTRYAGFASGCRSRC